MFKKILSLILIFIILCSTSMVACVAFGPDYNHPLTTKDVHQNLTIDKDVDYTFKYNVLDFKNINVKYSDSGVFDGYNYCYSSKKTEVYHTKNCGHLPQPKNRIYTNNLPNWLRLCSFCAN
ncbi:MAG: hypothetical protein LBD03_08030 [Methanobrevibacter sp.]|nr:hypothetical protein [Candidatus Methanovirga procula]